MASTRPPTFKSSYPFSNPLVTVPNAPITIGIIVTWIFHSFFNSLARSRYLSFFSHSFSFILWSAGTAKSTLLLFLLLLLYSFENFSLQCYLMVSQWSLRDRKSPQVSRTLLSILAYLNNALVCLVSTRPLIYKSSRPYINPLATVPSVPVTTGVNVTFMIRRFLFSLAKSRNLSFFSLSFSFSLWSAETSMSTIQQVIFLSYFFLNLLFFIGYHYFRSSGRDSVIRLYLKIPEKFMYLIFQDGFWTVHIPFVRMVKFLFLHHFQWITFPIKVWFGLVWFGGFYGISTFVGYLTPNPFLLK